MGSRNLTIDDVAREAGVARVTVSRVINRDPKVREQTRARVNQAIKKLGYSVNQQARALASGGAKRILLVHAGSPDREPNSYYDSGLELGALRACSVRGFDLASRTLDPEQDDLTMRLEQAVRDERPSGVILPPPLCDDDAVLAKLGELGVPVAAISASPRPAERVCSVGIDDYEAGRTIADHLLAIGHRELGFLSGPYSHRSAAMRLEGFRDRLAEIGLEPHWVAEGDFTFRSGIDQAHALLRSGTRITALACANDDMAAGAMLTFHREGLDLPDQLSITGFDDTPVSQIVWPPLTTIRQPIQSFGERAVELIASGSASATAVRMDIAFELILRESTASPK